MENCASSWLFTRINLLRLACISVETPLINFVVSTPAKEVQNRGGVVVMGGGELKQNSSNLFVMQPEIFLKLTSKLWDMLWSSCNTRCWEILSENLFLCFAVISMSVSLTSSRTLESCVFHFRLSHSTLSTISKHLNINSNTEKSYRDIHN